MAKGYMPTGCIPGGSTPRAIHVFLVPNKQVWRRPECGSVPAVAYLVANNFSIVVIGRNSQSGCDGNGMKSCFR
jgi:hypothetical protein